MQTQVDLSACVVSLNRDNKSMSQTDALPNDIEACHAIIRERFLIEDQQDKINESLARDNEHLKFEIEQLKRYIYGQRSERHLEDDSQLPLFDKHPESAAAIEDDAEVVEEEISYRRRKRSKADRFPENLPREVNTIDVPEEQRRCACCGEEMPIIDTDVRERLEYIPAKMVVHELPSARIKGAQASVRQMQDRRDGCHSSIGRPSGCGADSRFSLRLRRDRSNHPGQVRRSPAAVSTRRRFRSRRCGDPPQHAGRTVGCGSRLASPADRLPQNVATAKRRDWNG
jgi:hypothetical protein